MTLTVGQITERLQLLRSKVAVFETLINHTQSYYVDSDNVRAESVFLREDRGVVSQDHIQEALVSLIQQVDACREEMTQLESLAVTPALPAPTEAAAEAAAEEPQPATAPVVLPDEPESEEDDEEDDAEEESAPAVTPIAAAPPEPEKPKAKEKGNAQVARRGQDRPAA